jgi:uncharacterized OB-fold protein
MNAEGVTICACTACGHAVFPGRLLCPRCGSAEWRDALVRRGTVLATTQTRKRVIVHRLLETTIAEVRTDAGPIVIARLLGEATPGTEVGLATRAGGIVAEPLGG